MLVSIFPCKEETAESFYVRATRENGKLRISLGYRGTECRHVSIALEIPDDAVIGTYHGTNVDEINFYAPGGDKHYAQISVFNGYGFVHPVEGRKIFEKILREVKSTLAPNDYLKNLGEELLKELRKKKNVDKKTLERLEQFFGLVGAR